MPDLELDLVVQVEADGDAMLSEGRLAALSRFVLKENRQTGRWAIAVVLTSNRRIQELHREFMGIDSPTDVITFPADPVEGEFDHGGDIVVSVERAEEQGAELGLSKEAEIEFLVVHGLLHLCGWDDSDDAQRRRMLDYQSELIRQYNERQSA